MDLQGLKAYILQRQEKAEKSLASDLQSTVTALLTKIEEKTQNHSTKYIKNLKLNVEKQELVIEEVKDLHAKKTSELDLMMKERVVISNEL